MEHSWHARQLLSSQLMDGKQNRGQHRLGLKNAAKRNMK